MDNFDLKKYLAEGRLLKEEYNLPDSDSNTDKYINNHWDSILKDILRAHTDLRNSKGGENIPERPSQLDIDIVLGRFDGADEFTDVDPSVYEDYFDFYDMYLVTQRDEENIKSISDEDYPKGNYDGYTKRDDLPKLSEGKLLKENIDMATILSHDDYYDLYIGNKAEHDAADNEEQFSDEYITDLDPGMYQMIYWDDEGPNSMAFDNKLEYVKDSIAGFWGEDGFIEYFGIEDEVNAAGDNWESVFDKHLEDNLDMYYEELNRLINNSEPDGDSASGVVLLVNGKVVAGEAKEV